MDFLSPKLIVEFEQDSRSIVIRHPDRDQYPYPLVTIRPETYSAMTFEEASEFLGSRFLLLIPAMREQFKDELAKLAASETGKGFRQPPKT